MKLKIFILTTLVILASTLTLAPPVFADDFGLDTTAREAGLMGKFNKSLPTLIGNVIGAGLSLIAVLFFILTVYGGIMWMTARGKDEQSKRALDTILAAVIGMIIVLASYALTQFVFNSLSGEGGATTTPTPVVEDRRDDDNPVPSARNYFACSVKYLEDRINDETSIKSFCRVLNYEGGDQGDWTRVCRQTMINSLSEIYEDGEDFQEYEFDGRGEQSPQAQNFGSQQGANSACTAFCSDKNDDCKL